MLYSLIRDRKLKRQKMIFVDNETIATRLTHKTLIEALEAMFKSAYTMPVRHHHFYENKEGQETTPLLMPWGNSDYIGMKQVVVAPADYTKHLPAIHAIYALLEAVTGKPLAQMDAAELAARRTACASALA